MNQTVEPQIIDQQKFSSEANPEMIVTPLISDCQSKIDDYDQDFFDMLKLYM